jgi:D-alanyl-D-alanine carboxypeptidase (penicillin-binding protein 5/6)
MVEFTREKMTKKQRATLASYPIAVFVFFAFLLFVSIFIGNQKKHNEDNQPVITQEQIEQKTKKLQAILSNKNDILAQAIYQPVKKDNFYDLEPISAHSGIVLDAGSGTILWEKNSTQHRSIASMTKLVTAMVVIDRVRDLDEIVTIPPEVHSIEGTKVGCPTSTICNGERLRVGEQVRIRDLLKAMLMYSANDAATVLGIHVGGSEEEFAKLMNARMKELGAGNTHFCRPSGLEYDADVESCYSSAYDIARVVAHLLQYDKYDVLWDIMRTKETTFTSVDGNIEHELKNTDRLVGKMPNLVGAKTGFTPRAGYCLTLTSTDPTQKRNIISVVLDDYHRFDDVQTMSAWAFDNYTWQ